MKLLKRSFSVSAKLSKDWNSAGVTEGFEAEFGDSLTDEESFNREKELVTSRVVTATRALLLDKMSVEDGISLSTTTTFRK